MKPTNFAARTLCGPLPSLGSISCRCFGVIIAAATRLALNVIMSPQAIYELKTICMKNESSRHVLYMKRV